MVVSIAHRHRRRDGGVHARRRHAHAAAPVRGADRLVVPFQTVKVQSRAREDTLAWTFARYELLKAAVRGVDAMGFATWSDGIVRLAREDRPVRIEAITRSLLTTFSLDASVGRVFSADEDGATDPTTVAMISDRLWRTAFGASRSTIDSTIDDRTERRCASSA